MSSEQYQPNREVGSGGLVSPASPPPAPHQPREPCRLNAVATSKAVCVCGMQSALLRDTYTTLLLRPLSLLVVCRGLEWLNASE